VRRLFPLLFAISPATTGPSSSAFTMIPCKYTCCRITPEPKHGAQIPSEGQKSKMPVSVAADYSHSQVGLSLGMAKNRLRWKLAVVSWKSSRVASKLAASTRPSSAVLAKTDWKYTCCGVAPGSKRGAEKPTQGQKSGRDDQSAIRKGQEGRDGAAFDAHALWLISHTPTSGCPFAMTQDSAEVKVS